MTEARYQDILHQFEALAKDPLQTAKERGAALGKEVIGCAGMYFPEEILHAAGALPTVVLQQNYPISAANAHVQSFMCGYVRSLMDQAIEKKFSFMKALFIKDCCHEIRMIGDLVRFKQADKIRVEMSFFPVTIKKPESQKYIHEEILSLIRRTEELMGVTISREALASSIKVYNEARRRMMELYALRRNNPGIISAVDLSNIAVAGMCIPKEEHSAMVAELIEALREKDMEPIKGKTPVVVTGSLCEVCDRDLLSAIEKSGGVIVDDDLYVGARYYNTLVSETGDPAAALAEAYINRVGPCPTQHDPDNRLGDYIAGIVKNSGAKAVVTAVIKFCEAHYFSNLADQADLEKAGIPQLTVYLDHDASLKGQIETRVQSFLENL